MDLQSNRSLILIVEDDAVVSETLTTYLEHAGFGVVVATDGWQALTCARQRTPAMVILDLMIPGLDGHGVCRQLRSDSMVPILMLTSRTSEADRIAGLRLGADDYVNKPFSPREVVARVEAVLRRARCPDDEPPPPARCGALEVSFWSRQVRVGGRLVSLTPTEYRLLEILMRSPGRTFTRTELVARAFGPDFNGFDRTIDSHITNLRRKLDRHDGAAYVATVHGVGYRLAADVLEPRARLVAGVGVVAVTAVIAVAAAARQGTRTAFIQYQGDAQTHPHRLAQTHLRLSNLLDGRCCDADLMREAARELPADAGFVVVAAGDRIAGYAGAAFDGVTDVTVARGAHLLALRVVRGGLQFTAGIPTSGGGLRLADGQNAQVHAVRIPTGEELSRIRLFYGSLDRRLLLATSLIGSLVVGLTWWVSKRIVKPLDDLSEAARAVARGDLGSRVPVTGTDEVAALATGFNAMAAALERQERLRREFLTDVAHELRTPLTALRCRIESLIDGMAAQPAAVVADLHDDVMHLNRLVDDLQELSLAESGAVPLVLERVAVLPVLQSAVRAAGLEQDSRVRVDVTPAFYATADAFRLQQVLTNLLTNAARHTPASGEIFVRVRGEAGALVIEVRNTGSSLDVGQRDRVFDRLYRTDPARRRSTGGSGLGLAIVKSLVEAHGGRVWVDSTADEVVFGIALPSA